MSRLVEKIAHDQGFENSDEALDAGAWHDAVVPGIYVTCEMVHDSCEPDARDNYCEECGTPTVQSVPHLLGVI